MWWALNSPSLFHFSEEWPEARFIRQGIGGENPHLHLPFLQNLDENPDRFRIYFKEKGIRRLGKYFEQLIYCFLSLHPGYELILANHQVREGKRSIGELDLVYLDKKNESAVHLEIAVKFYLGMGDTQNWSQWLGPNTVDRLDLKLRKLLNKQSRLADHPALQETWERLGFFPKRQEILLKGYLFYPKVEVAMPSKPTDSYHGHKRSFWVLQKRFEAKEGKSYRMLPRLKWLSANDLGDAELVEIDPAKPLKKPVLMANFDESGLEGERFFLVPDEWLEKARRELAL